MIVGLRALNRPSHRVVAATVVSSQVLLGEGRDVAERARGLSYDALFRAAAVALYEAKRARRDRVVVDGDASEARRAGRQVRRRAA